jgi:DNA-binding PadR family transcriptional regulator
MGRTDYLGEFEELVLLAVARCASAAYGMEIRRELAARTGRDVSIGAVYATLERLVDKGFVRIGAPAADPDRDGRARRFFTIAPAGVDALEAAEGARARLRAGLRLKRSRS